MVGTSELPIDEDGPLVVSADRQARVSEAARRFVAHIVSHLPALVALSAPSPISCLELDARERYERYLHVY